MIQPNSTAFSYNPFRLSFAFSFITLVAWVVLLVLAVENCGTNCLNYNEFILPCVSGGTLYCCSLYNYSGNYYCGYYNSCMVDNYDCGNLSVGSWIAGSLLFLGIVLMILSACRFKKVKQQALLNAYQNMGNNQNQGWSNNPYTFQNNHPQLNQQQQNNHGYVAPNYNSQS